MTLRWMTIVAVLTLWTASSALAAPELTAPMLVDAAWAARHTNDPKVRLVDEGGIGKAPGEWFAKLSLLLGARWRSREFRSYGTEDLR